MLLSDTHNSNTDICALIPPSDILIHACDDEAYTVEVHGRTFKIFAGSFTPQHGNDAFHTHVGMPLTV
ncbi:hypothetical protein BDR06DRAFT_950625 [Suillus hirtellus]|nr:hypothetical protein BDR06DRAFT_950625 [Suillus hirtellus]